MKIIADTKPLLIQYKIEGKLYGSSTDGGTEAPFDEMTLEVGKVFHLNDNDALIRATVLGQEPVAETENSQPQG
jgi:hypothetical protein